MSRTHSSDPIFSGCMRRLTRKELENRKQRAIDACYGKLFAFLAQRERLPERADLLMVLGSSDLRVPIEAVMLYKQGKAANVVVCGGVGRLTEPEVKSIWGAEAIFFKEALIRMGMPEVISYIDSRSDNTSQNIENGFAVVRANGIEPKRVILIQLDVLQRRAGLTARKVAPEIEFINWAANIPANPDPTARKASLEEMRKLEIYGPRGAGFLVEPDIPLDVKRAYDWLKRRGK